MLDFSDATNRKVGSAFLLELLHMPPEHETHDDGNQIVIGDGISLGGDKKWAEAVSGLARKVHPAPGEFEEVFLAVVEELARPCRERISNFLQWMHCLAVTGLLLENVTSFRWMHGKSVRLVELLQSLLLPGAKHAHSDVRRAATRCLGLFGLLERNPSVELIKKLRLSFVVGPSSVSTVAAKALFDLGMWHGPQEVDKAMKHCLASQFRDHLETFHPVNPCGLNEDLDIELVDLLFAGLQTDDCNKSAATDEDESVQAVAAEGFAKILLLSENYPSIPSSLRPLLLAKLISIYFCSVTIELQRLKQCLSVFFEHYPSVSVNHKKCICKAFIPVMRLMWPGIYGNASGPSVMVSNIRKRAVQASRFLLQMLQAPLYSKEAEHVEEIDDQNLPEDADDLLNSSNEFESGEGGLALCIAVEVASFQSKKNSAEKSYLSAISRVLVLLRFRPSEQGPIKIMRQLINRVAESVSAEKEILKELEHMAERLKALDRYPTRSLSTTQANVVLERLGLKLELQLDEFSEETFPTPAPRFTRPTRARRRATLQEEESSSDDDAISQTSVFPTNQGTTSVRSQRASKTAAIAKITTTSRPVRIGGHGGEEDEDGEEESEVTTEDDSDECGLSFD